MITGAVRAAESSTPGHVRAYNSVYVIDPDGSIRGIYDKVHLVPFGEYLPFEPLLEKLGLQNLTKQVGGFLAGDRRRAMEVPGAPKMMPLICYEAIFPGARRCRAASGRAGSSMSPMTAGSATAAGPISISSRRA